MILTNIILIVIYTFLRWQAGRMATHCGETLSSIFVCLHVLNFDSTAIHFAFHPFS